MLKILSCQLEFVGGNFAGFLYEVNVKNDFADFFFFFLLLVFCFSSSLRKRIKLLSISGQDQKCVTIFTWH